MNSVLVYVFTKYATYCLFRVYSYLVEETYCKTVIPAIALYIYLMVTKPIDHIKSSHQVTNQDQPGIEGHTNMFMQ